MSGPSGEASDFGWIVERGETQYVTHWWSPDWSFGPIESGVAISGRMFAHREKLSNPLQHIVLRCLAFVLGRRLIPVLKRALIFKRGGQGEPLFTRTATHDNGNVEITDRIEGLRTTDRLLRAPRASKRHVASADSYHPQDLAPIRGFEVSEERRDTPNAITIVTRITPC